MLNLKEMFTENKRVVVLTTMRDIVPMGETTPFRLKKDGKWLETFNNMVDDGALEEKDSSVKLSFEGLAELVDYESQWNRSFMIYLGILSAVSIGTVIGVSI